MILDLIESVPRPRDRAPLAVGCFCGPRTSENFGLTWKSYADDHLIVYDTAYEGALYEGKVKTDDSRARIPIPHRVRPYIEAWRKVCPNTSPDALMFPAQGHRKNKGLAVPFRAKNFFKWKVWPVSDKLGIPRNLCTFQVFRRTLGTDLQKHGTMKDAQATCATSTSRRPPRCIWTTYQTAYAKPLTPGRRRYLGCAGRSVLGNLPGFS